MVRVRIYPHNDLSNLAHYQLSVIKEKMEADDRSGIALDCMSCLIALAFSVEAFVNFVGFKRVRDWKERQPLRAKLKTLAERFKLDYSERAEPFARLLLLKALRDQLAHGQPIEAELVVEDARGMHEALRTPWDPFLTPVFAVESYQIVQDFEESLLRKATITLGDTLTSGSGTWSTAKPACAK